MPNLNTRFLYLPVHLRQILHRKHAAQRRHVPARSLHTVSYLGTLCPRTSQQLGPSSRRDACSTQGTVTETFCLSVARQMLRGSRPPTSRLGCKWAKLQRVKCVEPVEVKRVSRRLTNYFTFHPVVNVEVNYFCLKCNIVNISFSHCEQSLLNMLMYRTVSEN